MEVLDTAFLERDTVAAARALLGLHLCHQTRHGLISGIIVETEAYLSRNDSACHASQGITSRNKTMFAPAGRAYVYLIYGKYYCFNVVTGSPDKGEAVLIRAVEPVSGLDLMHQHRGVSCSTDNLTSGPGKLCHAFAIDQSFDGHNLKYKPLYLKSCSSSGRKMSIIATPRIGISSAKDKMLRFIVSGSQYLSRRETSG